jgi:hypothetical protein
MALEKKYSLDEIQRINATNSAVYKQVYIDVKNRYHLGLPDGKLRLLFEASEIPYNDKQTKLGVNNVQDAINGLFSSIAEIAQDAVGDALLDTADIDFTYNDSVPSISAVLTTTGVVAGNYGSATDSVQITVDSKGRLTAVTQVPIVPSSIQNPYANILMLGGM